MNFIEAVIAIHKREDLRFCKVWTESEDELSGKHDSICIYKKDGSFVGKLRWPHSGFAPVDEELEEELGKAS